MLHRHPGATLLAVATCVIAAATLVPVESAESLPRICVFCGPLGGVDFVLNVLLFVPFGFAFRLVGSRFRFAIACGVLLTIGIEALQIRMISGRDASIGDVIANTLGTAWGYWLAMHAGRWLRAKGSFALRLSFAFAILVSLILLVTSTLLLPAIPGWPLFIEWTPQRSGTALFSGRLLSAEINQRPILGADSIRLGTNPESLSTEFTVGLTLGLPTSIPELPAIIVRVANSTVHAFTLTQRREGVLFRSHALGSQLKLRAPVVALRSVFPPATAGRADGTILVEASSNRQAIAVRSELGEERRDVSVSRTFGLGWVLLAPRDFQLGESWWLVNALWLGTLVFPVSFFTKRSVTAGRGLGASVVRWLPAALVVGAMVAAIAVTGISAPGPGECLGLFGGACFGWLTERFVATDHPAYMNESITALIED